jgi:hypothetical protein
MSRNNAYGDDEIAQQNLYVSSHDNANNVKGLTDLGRFAFSSGSATSANRGHITQWSSIIDPPEKDLMTASTSLTNLCNVPMTSSHFPFFPAPNGYQSPGSMPRTAPPPIYLGSQQMTPRENHNFSYDPGYGPHFPREMEYNPGLQDYLPGGFDLGVCVFGLQSEVGSNFVYRATNTYPSMVLVKIWLVFSCLSTCLLNPHTASIRPAFCEGMEQLPCNNDHVSATQ